MARVRDHDAVYAAAERFVERALRRNSSVFGARRRWAPELLAALVEGLDGEIGRPAAGASFASRWERLLGALSPEVVELAAEVLAVHLLVPTDVAPATKHRLVGETLTRSPRPPRVPPVVTTALDRGLVPCGMAYTRQRLSQLRLLARAAGDWKASPAAERRVRLADPDVFGAWLRAVPGSAPQRAALCHLVHPDAFEPIVSLRMKRAAADRFAELGGDEADLDRRLARIRAALEPEHGPGFAFADLPAVREALG